MQAFNLDRSDLSQFRCVSGVQRRIGGPIASFLAGVQLRFHGGEFPEAAGEVDDGARDFLRVERVIGGQVNEPSGDELAQAADEIQRAWRGRVFRDGYAAGWSSHGRLREPWRRSRPQFVSVQETYGTTVTVSTLKFLSEAFFPENLVVASRNPSGRRAFKELVFPHAQEAALIVWGAVVACLASLAGTLGLGPMDASTLGSLPEIMLVVSLFTLICAAEATG